MLWFCGLPGLKYADENPGLHDLKKCKCSVNLNKMKYFISCNMEGEHGGKSKSSDLHEEKPNYLAAGTSHQR